jgi:hypothetical protein
MAAVWRILLCLLPAARAAEIFWQPTSLFIPDNTTTYATSDYRTSLSGDGITVAIGLPSYRNSRGAVWTYRRTATNDDDHSGTWRSVGPPLLGDVEGSQVGYALALNGDGQVLVVGSPWTNDSLPSWNVPSRAHVYRWAPADASNDDDGSWQPAGAALLEAPVLDRVVPDFTWYQTTGSGTAVATSEDGTVVAVAAPSWTVYNRTDDAELPVEIASGRVVVYQWNATSNDWQVVGDAIVGLQSRHLFGFSIGLAANGRRIVIGAPQLSYWVGTTPDALGSALVYELDQTDGLSQWKQMGDAIHGDDEGDAAGYSVAMASDGQRIMVGYPYGGRGRVRVFDWIGVEWEQTGRDIVPDGSTGYGEGHSVAISGDSSTIAVYSPAQSCNCVTSGLVRLFRLVCNTTNSTEDCDWIQVGDMLPGERGRGEADNRGRTLSLQHDGSRLALASSFQYECDWLDWNCESPCYEPDWTGSIRVLDLLNVTETPVPSLTPTASPTTSPTTSPNTVEPSFPDDAASMSYSIAQRGPSLAGIVLGLGLLLT